MAIVSAAGDRTFAELDREARAFAGGLDRLGIGPGSTMGILCTNRVEWVVATLGTIIAGGRVATFNTWSKRWDLEHLLSASRCDALVSVATVGEDDRLPLLEELIPEAFTAGEPGWRSYRFPNLRELVLIGDGSPQGTGARCFEELLDGELLEEARAGRDETALVLYTSGSTARPKAVALQQGIALEHGFDVGERMGVGADDRVWLPVPLFWSYGGANALMVALTHGAQLVLQEQFVAGEALDLIERHRATVAYTLPNITAALLSDPGFDAERVRTLERGMTIGAPADVEAAADGLGIPGICNAYGSTEIYGCCTATPHDWPLERKTVTQGPPLPRIGVTIADPESGRPLKQGEIGEITVRGQVTTGYIDAPEDTPAPFTGDGAFRTGDLGHLDPDGNVVFAARASEMIRTGGINVAPAEVEEFLRTHPSVSDAVVTGADDEAKGEVVIAFVIATGAPPFDEAELRSWCREHIASFKVPVRVIDTRAPFPATPTGKLARKQVRAMAMEVWRGDGS